MSLRISDALLDRSGAGDRCCACGYAQQSSSVTQADIQRLQDNVYLADRDISQLRSRDATRATQLQTELDDLRDEVVYLKVKLRKERTLSRTEYADVRDRIEDLRSRARGDVASHVARTVASLIRRRALQRPRHRLRAGTRATPATDRSFDNDNDAPAALEIPVGTEIDVRLQNRLNSGTAQVEDRFEAHDARRRQRRRPRGDSGRRRSMRGVVTAVEPATRTNRTAQDDGELRSGHGERPLLSDSRHGDAGDRRRRHQGRGRRESAAGAGVGAIIGGILGGFKGALAGDPDRRRRHDRRDRRQGSRAAAGIGPARADRLAAFRSRQRDARRRAGRSTDRLCAFRRLSSPPRAAAIVFLMCASVCAADRNHASNCDGGG